jgi:hypothetical protein
MRVVDLNSEVAQLSCALRLRVPQTPVNESVFSDFNDLQRN